MIITKQGVALGIPAFTVVVTMLVIFATIGFADTSDAEKSKTAVFHAKNSIWVGIIMAVILAFVYLTKDRGDWLKGNLIGGN